MSAETKKYSEADYLEVDTYEPRTRGGKIANYLDQRVA